MSLLTKIKEKVLGIKVPAKGRENIVLEKPAYYNRHKGRDFLVLGTGSTLNEYGDRIKQFIAEKNLLVIGVNDITSFIVPQYQSFTNRFRLSQYGGTVVVGKTRGLMSIYFSDQLIAKFCKSEYDLVVWKKVEDASDSRLDENGIISHYGGSASLMVLVAYAMGARKIYVAGADGYRDLSSSVNDIHYNDASYKSSINPEVLEEKTKHWFISVQPKTFDAISNWADQNGREMFAMITPTQYSKFFDPEILGIG